jgi:putative spermidine/putrescine transport system substrate-binding protein
VAPTSGSAQTGGSAAPGTASTDEQFPASIFGNLSGTVGFMDASGGTVAQAKNDTVWKNFTDHTGVKLQQDFQADTSKFVALAEANADIPWDVLEIPTVAEFEALKAKGLLQPLDTSVVPVDQMEPGNADEFGVAVELYTANVTWNTDKWPLSGKHPQGLEDVFNTTDFPGKRCMFNYPEFGATLESPLLADGVPPDQLYPLDVDRALKKLDTIKDDIVWWDTGAKDMELFASGECDIGIAWPGRVLARVQDENAPLAIGWGSSIMAHSVLAIPKNAPHPELGNALISWFLRDQQGQVDYVNRTSYITQTKSLSSADDYPEAIRSWLPLGDNAKGAIPQDDKYYAANMDDITSTFTAWLAQ